MEEHLSKREAAALLAAGHAALTRFPQLTSLQVGPPAGGRCRAGMPGGGMLSMHSNSGSSQQAPAPVPPVQLCVGALPKGAARALSRLSRLCSLDLTADRLSQGEVDAVMGLSTLTSLALHSCRGLLPARRLLELPQRLPLLANLALADAVQEAPAAAPPVPLPPPAAFPKLQTFRFTFQFPEHRHCEVGRRSPGHSHAAAPPAWRPCALVPGAPRRRAGTALHSAADNRMALCRMSVLLPSLPGRLAVW